MSVCVVNLVALDPESEDGLNRVAKEMSQLLVDLAQEQAGFYPIFVVGDGFAARFAAWIERNPLIIPVNPQQPDRPLVRGLNPDVIISPLFSAEPFNQIREFAQVRQIIVPPDLAQPYRQYLLESAPEVFGQASRSTTPSVSLPMALQEIQRASASHPQVDVASIEASSLAALPEANLNLHLNYLDELIQQEQQLALARLPIIGRAVRAVIRLHNIGRFWRSSSIVAREIGRRQAQLAARMNMQDADLGSNQPISSEDAR